MRLLRATAFAMVALLTMSVSAVWADTCACDPIQPFLAVDPHGTVHAAYRNSGTPGIVYATNVSGRWVRSRITSGRDEPGWIAVDSHRKVYIVFRREFTDNVAWYYMTNRSGSWATVRLAWMPDAAYAPRLEVGPDRNLHLVYENDEEAVYARRTSSGWVTRRLDVSMGQSPVLAIAANGAVHLAFRQCLNDGVGTCDGEGIYHETDASGAWVRTRLTTSQFDVAQDLKVDTVGRVHLVFYQDRALEELQGGLFYMTNRSGAWVTQRFSTYGRMARLALDSQSKARVVYTRIDDGYGLFYATNQSGRWTWSSFFGDWALYPSLGIDGGNKLHVVFMRMETDPGIYYTTNKSGAWTRLELMD